MPPRTPPAYAAQDLLCCLGLGLLAGVLRAGWPARGRLAFWADMGAVGLLLVLAQGYAAGYGLAGGLRWYMLAGGAAGFAAGQTAAQRPVQALVQSAHRLLCRCAVALAGCLALPAGVLWRGIRAGAARRKRRKKRSRAAKNAKKNLQTERRLLYNSNV